MNTPKYDELAKNTSADIESWRLLALDMELKSTELRIRIVELEKRLKEVDAIKAGELAEAVFANPDLNAKLEGIISRVVASEIGKSTFYPKPQTGA